MYREVRKLLSSGSPDVVGLERLQWLVEKGTLRTLDEVVKARDLIERIARADVSPDASGYQLLHQRRGDRFAALVDMCNWDLFLAADSVLRDYGIVAQMTTSGNLTLEAFRRATPGLKKSEIPGRHLGTPYVRNMLRQYEPSRSGRRRKLMLGVELLEEILQEVNEVEEAKAIVNLAQTEGNDGSSRVGVSKRLYDTIKAWQDLFFFPYMKQLDETVRADTPDEGEDISAALTWSEAHREELQRRAEATEKKTRTVLVQMGRFEDQSIVERFVPHHREAEKILLWLRA
jgi:hypothetical protein